MPCQDKRQKADEKQKNINGSQGIFTDLEELQIDENMSKE